MPSIRVRISKGDDRLTAFKQPGGILSDVQVPFKPSHVAVFSVCEPAEEGIEMRRTARP
jgi:hypothetical protein